MKENGLEISAAGGVFHFKVAIDSVQLIPKLLKSEAAVGEPDTEPPDQLTISGVSPKYNSFFVSGVSPIISNISFLTCMQSFKARIDRKLSIILVSTEWVHWLASNSVMELHRKVRFAS